jgi:hypothetical protein
MFGDTGAGSGGGFTPSRGMKMTPRTLAIARGVKVVNHGSNQTFAASRSHSHFWSSGLRLVALLTRTDRPPLRYLWSRPVLYRTVPGVAVGSRSKRSRDDLSRRTIFRFAKGLRVSSISVGRLLKRGWMLLVVVVVVAGFCVYRLQGIFGSRTATSTAGGFSNETAPFDPKHGVLRFSAAGHGGVDELPGCLCSAAAR